MQERLRRFPEAEEAYNEGLEFDQAHPSVKLLNALCRLSLQIVSHL